MRLMTQFLLSKLQVRDKIHAVWTLLLKIDIAQGPLGRILSRTCDLDKRYIQVKKYFEKNWIFWFLFSFK